MNKILEFQNLIEMLRELDLERNDKKTIRNVLDFIAQELDKYIDDIKENK